MSKKGKAILRYIVITLISGTIGGFIGYMMMKNRCLPIDTRIFKIYFPIVINVLLLFSLLIIIIISFTKYIQGKKLMKLLDDDNDDEDIYLNAQEKIDKAMSWSFTGQILGFIMMGLVIPIGLNTDNSTWAIMLSIITVSSFAIYILYATVLSVKTVEAIKKMSPEKKGYVLDKKFNKEWLESCDEAERKIIGEASYYSYTLTTKLFSYAMALSLILTIFVPDGYVFIIIFGIVWLVSALCYQKKANELEFKKKRGMK